MVAASNLFTAVDPNIGGAGITISSSDNATVAIRDRIPMGARFALVDVETGAVREPLGVPDAYPQPYSHLAAGGWISSGDRLVRSMKTAGPHPLHTGARFFGRFLSTLWDLYAATVEPEHEEV